MRFNRLLLLLSVPLMAFVFGCSRGSVTTDQADGKSMQINGSDTIVNLVQAWAEEFTKQYPTINIGVTGGGSGTGFAALLNGTCDIAMSSRVIEDKEQNEARANNINPLEFVVGLDGLAVVVHPSNPVSRLTMEDLRDIFMAHKTNWKDFGGEDSPIVILSRESNSGTHMFFKEHVLRRGNKKGKEEFSPEALLMPSSQVISDEVKQNPHAIGYVGMGYICTELKAIAIAGNTTSPYIAPTVDNVMNNSYPISRPLYLYTNGEPHGEVKEFIDFALSPEGQAIVKNTDFVPIGSCNEKVARHTH
jgi:phosphate transport system substrate-binding protein